MGDLGFLAADFPMADKIAERLRRHIEATAPWLLDDSKTGPVVAKLQEAAQKAEANAAELMTQLADVRMKLRGKDELRDIEAENAKSKRLVDEAHAAKEIVELGEGHGLKKLVQQTIAELLGFDPDQIERANKDVIAEQSRENVSAGNGNGNAQT
ncbi:MAG: hypothetical protein KGL35_08735, partial [Bradyrhizobium sp.]|nr:hypothetical protein [Bradyrhizobium sp.]